MWLVTFVPLLIFVIVDFFSGLRSGIVAAVVVALLSVGFLWFGLGVVDWESLFAVVVMTVCGWAAIKHGSPVLFKLQPVITSGIVVLYLAYCQFFGTPFLIRSWPVISQLMPSEQADFFGSAEGQSLLSSLSLYLIVWTVVHIALVAWAALRKSNLVWIVIKGLGVPFILAGSLVTIVAKGVLGG